MKKNYGRPIRNFAIEETTRKKTQYYRTGVYNRYVKVTHGELLYKLHQLEFDSLDFNIR